MGKVLLGESPECGLDILPSKAGVQTVLEVLQIQMNFWPTLGPRFSDLQSQWGTYCLKNKSEDLSALLMHSSIIVQLLYIYIYIYIYINIKSEFIARQLFPLVPYSYI